MTGLLISRGLGAALFFLAFPRALIPFSVRVAFVLACVAGVGVSAPDLFYFFSSVSGTPISTFAAFSSFVEGASVALLLSLPFLIFRFAARWSRSFVLPDAKLLETAVLLAGITLVFERDVPLHVIHLLTVTPTSAALSSRIVELISLSFQAAVLLLLPLAVAGFACALATAAAIRVGGPFLSRSLAETLRVLFLLIVLAWCYPLFGSAVGSHLDEAKSLQLGGGSHGR